MPLQALSAYKQALEIDPMNEEVVKLASSLRAKLKAEGNLNSGKQRAPVSASFICLCLTCHDGSHAYQEI